MDKYMSFKEYQYHAAKTAVFKSNPSLKFFTNKNREDSTQIEVYDAVPLYPFLGLAEEAGEVLGKVEKAARDGHTYQQMKDGLVLELGDVLWYISAICGALNVSMEDVAKQNLDKLWARQANNTLHGSGDNR